MSFGGCFVCGGGAYMKPVQEFYKCDINGFIHAACLGAHVHSTEGDLCRLAGGFCWMSLQLFSAKKRVHPDGRPVTIVGWPPSKVMRGWK